MEIRYTEGKKLEPIHTTRMELWENDVRLTRIAAVTTRPTRYHSQWISTMTVGGVATDPEHRRGGYVKHLLNELFSQAEEKDWVVSLLHPFSFSYYRKFGYERVADHRILEFPLNKLDHVPRVNDFVLLQGSERISDVLKVYEKFFEHRNLSFRRFGGEHLPTEPDFKKKVCYIRYRGKEPVAVVIFNLEKQLVVNHMDGVMLNVFEMAYVDKEALLDIFGFLRMFDGEMDRVTIHNCAMAPEVELLLRHYTHLSVKILPDLMAKVLNTEKLLQANDFPKEHGRFVLGVEDSLPTVAGVFSVEYQDGKAEVKRLCEHPEHYGGTPDLVCDSCALSRILYGYHSLNKELLSYMDGVKLTGDPADLIRAYPQQTNGLYEHF
jgi:predicted acetyltransferase